MAAILRKFFADRGTHLAAMIAYFALLSFVPLLFLSLALLGLGQRGRLRIVLRPRAPPDVPEHVGRLDRSAAVRAIQDNATALGIVGAAFLLWSSLSLFSVLESAFNIVYDRPNRAVPARQGARDADDGRRRSRSSFVSLVVGSIGVELLKRYTGLDDNVVVAYVAVGHRLARRHLRLPRVRLRRADERRLRWREVAARRGRRPPCCSRRRSSSCRCSCALSKHNPVLQTLSGPAVLLVWLYVMANVIVHRRRGQPAPRVCAPRL